MTSYSFRSRAAKTSRPSDATSAVHPSDSSRQRATSWLTGLSSASRILPATRLESARVWRVTTDCVPTFRPMTTAMQSNSSDWRTGLLRYASIPAFRASAMSPRRPIDVSMMRRADARAGSDLIACATWMPFISGIIMSRITRSKGSCFEAVCMASRAAGPLSTQTSRMLHPVTKWWSSSRLVALSSTTRTRRPCRSRAFDAEASSTLVVLPKRAVNQNVEPMPGTLSTPIAPPIISASCFAIARPSPVPPYFRVVEPSACVKAVKILARVSSSIPIPVSRTSNLRRRVDSVSSSTLTRTTTSPRSVNLTALPIRLSRIWRKRPGSPRAGPDDLGEHETRQLELLRVRPLGEQLADVFDRLPQVEMDLLQLELPGFDLGEVQDVVDQPEERLGGRPDRVREPSLLRRELRAQEELGHPDHAVHGRADLVAHVRQELRLGLVRLLRATRQLLRALRGGLQLFAVDLDLPARRAQARHHGVERRREETDLVVAVERRVHVEVPLRHFVSELSDPGERPGHRAGQPERGDRAEGVEAGADHEHAQGGVPDHRFDGCQRDLDPQRSPGFAAHPHRRQDLEEPRALPGRVLADRGLGRRSLQSGDFPEIRSRGPSSR